MSKAERNHEESVKTYDSKINGLNDTIAALNNSTDMMKKEIARLEEGASVVNALQDKVKQLEADLEVKKTELQECQRDREQDSIKHEREIMSLEKQYREEKQVAVDQYQAKYLELLEKLQAGKDVSQR